MAKKLSDWERRLNELKESAKGTMPWMATCDLDKWYDIEVKASTIAEEHDAGPDEKWSCYRCEARHPESDGAWIQMEVPFWAMEGFLNAVLESVGKEGEAYFEYKRTLGNKGLNEAEFQWS